MPITAIVHDSSTDPSAAGGDPHGVSVTASGSGPTEADLTHARDLGERVTEVAKQLAR